MSKNASTVVGKIKQNFFMATDVISMEIVVEKLTPLTMSPHEFLQECPEVVNELQEILLRGSSCIFNPTNVLLCISGSTESALDEEKLCNYVGEKACFDAQELDVNNNVTTMRLPVEILIENARLWSDEMIMKSSYYTVQTLFGRVQL